MAWDLPHLLPDLRGVRHDGLMSTQQAEGLGVPEDTFELRLVSEGYQDGGGRHRAVMSQARKLVLWGLGLLALGLLVGLLPMSVSSGYGATACGSVFIESSAARIADRVDAMSGIRGGAAGRCSEARSGRLPLVWVPLAVGGALLIAAAVVDDRAGRRTPGP